jgi:general secretion pathway protein A
MSARIFMNFGLKFNPFSIEIPIEACLSTQSLEHFFWRMENLTKDGGFALVLGESGMGKSITLRLLWEKLASIPDLSVSVLTRPQSSLSDFYRELGELFGVSLSPSNRWGLTKVLRERWKAHMKQSLLRPVIIIDEAQEMKTDVLKELRLLGSFKLDSQRLITVILAGDNQLIEQLRKAELLALGSRLRVRLKLNPSTPEQLMDLLNHVLKKAGNSKLIAEETKKTLCHHSAGNPRILMNHCQELLEAAVYKDVPQIDEQLYFEVFSANPKKRQRRSKAQER